MSAGGVQALLKGSGVVAGRAVVVAGTGPFLLPVAADLVRMGGHVPAVVEANSPASLLRHPRALVGAPARAPRERAISGASAEPARRTCGGTWSSGRSARPTLEAVEVARVGPRWPRSSPGPSAPSSATCSRSDGGSCPSWNSTCRPAAPRRWRAMARWSSTSTATNAHRSTACGQPARRPAWGAPTSRSPRVRSPGTRWPGGRRPDRPVRRRACAAPIRRRAAGGVPGPAVVRRRGAARGGALPVRGGDGRRGARCGRGVGCDGRQDGQDAHAHGHGLVPGEGLRSRRGRPWWPTHAAANATAADVGAFAERPFATPIRLGLLAEPAEPT